MLCHVLAAYLWFTFYAFVVWEFVMGSLIKFPYCMLLQSQPSSSCVLPWMLRSLDKPPVFSPSSRLQSLLLAMSLGAVPRCGQEQHLGFAAC